MYIPPCAPTRVDDTCATLRESFVFTFYLLNMHQFLASLHFVRGNVCAFFAAFVRLAVLRVGFQRVGTHLRR